MPPTCSPAPCFNPRPRTGGDMRDFPFRPLPRSFNPRPRTGGDMLQDRLVLPLCSFNPRPRTGGDGCDGTDAEFLTGFQSTPPYRRRRFWHASRDREQLFQSTPPYRRRHILFPVASVLSRVSIHAPVQEATCRCHQPSDRHHVSIHAPVQEATNHHCFNPSFSPVSIHAPVQEATSFDGCNIHICIRCFNPRPRTGGDGLI